jgi:(p)ppGpp synthase/HD superfamily hydrolase
MLDKPADKKTQAKMLKPLLSFPFSKEEKEKISRAFCLAEEHYRKEKKPEMIAALPEVAGILLTELNLSAEAALAILLKEFVPRKLSEEQIVKDFGKPVWELISGLQKIDRMDTAKYTSHAENFIKLMLTHEMKVSVRSTRVKTHPDDSYTCEIGILINSTVRLDEVMKKLLKLKEVQSVNRAGSA